MSTNSGAGNGTAKLMTHSERIDLGKHDRQADADGRVFYSSGFFTPPATGTRAWRWTLMRSGDGLFDFCIESLGDQSITLSSAVLYGYNSGTRIGLTEKQNIGQPSYQSAYFSVTNRLPDLDEEFTRNYYTDGIYLKIKLEWTEATVNASAVVTSSDGVLEGLYAKVIGGGDTVYELMSSDGQPFSVNIAILEAKSAYFKRFFATDGWKEQTEGRMVLVWTSAVVRQVIRYLYLNNVDGDVCELLPDVLDAAQMWELVGMKSVIEWQMQQRLHKAAENADTDTAAEYLKMSHLHSLTSIVPLCNGILADNFDKFYDSECCKQMINSSEFTHLVKAVFHHERMTHN